MCIPKMKIRICRERHDGSQAGHRGSNLKRRRIGVDNLEKHIAAYKRRGQTSRRKVAQTAL